MGGKPGDLYLGQMLDESTSEPTEAQLQLPSHGLTTHGVIVGMTGSGKTGLGVVLLEEILSAGIPALILDPKGDMGNLLLNFPSFDPQEFRALGRRGRGEEKGDFHLRAGREYGHALEGGDSPVPESTPAGWRS